MAKRRFTDDTDGRSNDDRRSKRGGTVPFSEMRFVNLELSEKEKEEFRALLAADEFTGEFLDTCIKAGYKITYSADKNGGGVLCSIRCEAAGLLDSGLILTGRGKSARIALAVCEYKSAYLSDENGWAAAENARGRSQDDIG